MSISNAIILLLCSLVAGCGAEPNPNPNTFYGSAYYHACGWIYFWQERDHDKTESLAHCRERFVHDKHIDHTDGALILPKNESTERIDTTLRKAFDDAARVHGLRCKSGYFPNHVMPPYPKNWQRWDHATPTASANIARYQREYAAGLIDKDELRSLVAGEH